MDDASIKLKSSVVQAFSDVFLAETNGTNKLNIAVALKAIRTKDHRIRSSLCTSRDYYRLLFDRAITDDFQRKLIECGDGATTIGDFLGMWQECMPGKYEEVIDDRDVVRLREAFDSLKTERSEGVCAERVNHGLAENMHFKAVLSTSEKLKLLLFQPLEPIVGSRDSGRFVTLHDFLSYCSLYLPHKKQQHSLGPVAESIFALPQRTVGWGIPPCRAVTHFQIKQLATILSVDTEKEVPLLWVVKQALETPPPPGVVASSEEQGEDREVAGFEAAKAHVAYEYIRDLLEYERQSLRLEDTGSAEDVWMRFQFPRADGKGSISYFYNFARNEISGEHPVKRGEKLMEDENGLINAPLAKTFSLNQLRKKRVFKTAKQQPSRKPKGHGTRKKAASSQGQWKILVFKAWWTEAVPTLTEKSLRRRYVDICFHVRSGSCQLRIDGSANLFTLSHLNGRHGPIESWDLYVGRKVELLGRSTTLMQADLSTQQWNYYFFKKFSRAREKALKEVAKYDSSVMASAFQRKLQVGNTVKVTHDRSDGSINLRAYIEDTQLLITELEKYRPKIAHKLLRNTLSMLESTGEALVQ